MGNGEPKYEVDESAWTTYTVTGTMRNGDRVEMSLTRTVPDEIARVVEELSQRAGTPPERLLLDAIQAHWPVIPSPVASA